MAHINRLEAFDIMHGEERRMEIVDVKAVQRNEKIDQLAMEYFEDAGTFFEFIQKIEIGEDDSQKYEYLHASLRHDTLCAGAQLSRLFNTYCKEKAIEGVDNE